MATQVYANVNGLNADWNEAEVALYDAHTWLVIGRDWRVSSMHSFQPMPVVTCPVVDLSGVNEKAAQRALSGYLADGDRDVLVASLLCQGALLS